VRALQWLWQTKMDAPIIGEAPYSSVRVAAGRARLDVGNTENELGVPQIVAGCGENIRQAPSAIPFGIRAQGIRQVRRVQPEIFKAEVLVRLAADRHPQRGCMEGLSFGCLTTSKMGDLTRQSF